MRYTCPLTDTDYDLPEDTVRNLIEGRELWGDTWLRHEMINLHPQPMNWNVTLQGVNQFLAQRNERPQLRAGEVPLPPQVIVKQYFQKEEPMAILASTLTFPIIPEVREDGSKKLYKTRYNELETKYAHLHRQLMTTNTQMAKLNDQLVKLDHSYANLQKRAADLETRTADSDLLDKRITQVCKEIKLEMPLNRYGILPLESKLDAFFGAVLCRIRNEEELDELAD